MVTDIDDVLEPILRRTLVLWLVPYVVWFLSQHYLRHIWDWVTEPVSEDI